MGRAQPTYYLLVVFSLGHFRNKWSAQLYGGSREKGMMGWGAMMGIQGCNRGEEFFSVGGVGISRWQRR